MPEKGSKKRSIVPLSHEGGAIIPADKLHEQRRQFESPAREVTLSEVFDYYSQAEKSSKIKAAAGALLPIIFSHSQLPSLLSKYNTLDAARAKGGYQKTVEEMERVVYDLLSFERGFSKLQKLREKADVDFNIVKLLRIALAGHFSDEEALALAVDLSASLTSEEMTWISVLESLPSMLIEHKLSSVPAIVDHFWDGVEWSLDTLARDKSDERPSDTYEMAGLTGARDDTQFSPFIPKVALAMRGLYLGIVSDAQIFNQVFDDLDSAALVSGDGKILRAFAAREGKAFDDRYAVEVRQRVNDFLSDLAVINILKGSLMSPSEVVRLIGMLEIIPAFLFERRVVAMIPSGRGVMFLDPATLGEIEYVSYDPFVSHIAQNEIYHGTNSIDREAPVWRLLFEKIREHIRQKNDKEGNFTKLEKLIKDIKDNYGIKVKSAVEKTDIPDQLRLFLTKKINYTVKMGYWDLFCVSNILSEIPKRYLTGIKSIERKASGDIYSEMLYGIFHAGTFNRETGALDLIIPPVSSDDRLGASSMRYSLTIAHEVGHSIYDQFAKAWKRLSKASNKFPISQRRAHFVTAYASTGPEEDFAESFACYYVFGDDFRALAAKHPVLARKYAFIKRLFDGRKFEQRTDGLSIVEATGNINYDFNLRRRVLEKIAKGADPLTTAIMHRRNIESLKDANRPIEGPELIQMGAGCVKHKKAPEPHVRTYVDPKGIVCGILIAHVGEKMANVVDVNEIAEWLMTGETGNAVAELTNMTGLPVDRCCELIGLCYEGMRAMHHEVESTDEQIEATEKKKKDPRGRTEKKSG